MSFTWNSGRGYPGPYNDSDFTSEFLGPASGQWTWNRGLGFPGPWNDSSFVTDPGTPGGDFLAVSSAFDGIVVGTLEEIDGFDVIIEAYGGVSGYIGVPQFTIERLDVDSMDIPLTETGRIEFTWA